MSVLVKAVPSYKSVECMCYRRSELVLDWAAVLFVILDHLQKE